MAARSKERAPDIRRPLCFVGVVAALSLAVASPSAAATFSAKDGGSLMRAVQSANATPGPSTIDLLPGTYAPTTTLTIKGTLKIDGPSSPAATAVGGAITPLGGSIFDVEPGADATFTDVLMDDAGNDGQGAAIDDYGAVTLDNSTLSANDAPGLLVEVGAKATVLNSTIADGLLAGIVDDGAVTLTNTTVAGNRADGIDNREGTLRLTNTIVAENGIADCTSAAQASDDSLDSDDSCDIGALSGVDPLLGQLLLSNGGPTPTEALAAGSPAIGAGDERECPAIDQRHTPRATGRCDIGAYQAAQAMQTPAPSSPSAPAPGSTGQAGLPASAPGGTRVVVIGVSGHGTLVSRRVTFTLAALITRPHGSFTFHDATKKLWLQKGIVASVKIDAARGIFTIRGTALWVERHRRVSFVVTVVDHGGDRSLKARLPDGYVGGGRLAHGAITLKSTTSV